MEEILHRKGLSVKEKHFPKSTVDHINHHKVATLAKLVTS